MQIDRLMVAAFAAAFMGSSTAAAQDNTAEKTCKKPELREQVNVSAEQMNYLTESTRSYLDCMKPVIEAQRVLAQKTLDEGRADAIAANAAVTEVNSYIQAFRAYQAKHKDDK